MEDSKQQQQQSLHHMAFKNPMMMMNNNMGGAIINTPVVMVNNLNEEKINCDCLFILCGVFGDVVRVKISYNRRDTAFVQMANYRQACFVVHCLDRIQLFGKMIHVSLSRMTRVKLPKDSPTSNSKFPDAKSLTKDYTNTKMHRFGGKSSHLAANKGGHNDDETTINLTSQTTSSNGLTSLKYNPVSIGKPSQILHISNLPERCTKEEVFNLLGGEGFVIAVEIIPKPQCQAFVKCPSVDIACQVLMLHHGTEFHSREIALHLH
ncbi:hypothetical protein RFI_14495 [Reticulomyxa filosa]|uniref:RRM domain-containing protein n=1 Tax=Reticulomyxa filosa TaxID=46433 RepID=X6NBJ7_RETFI|nr:hypothetical protein RFI_14495 [Reticulomyxa filosa]|eukprot:ETO22697.1 hypothetical protein RFI_14495 [Reticulomyxa filosa]